MSDKDNQAENQSQDSDGHPLFNTPNQFGRAFFFPTQAYPAILPPQTLPTNVITVWKRLETGEHEPEQTSVNRKSFALEGMGVKRLEPKEPLDFLEYCRRKN